MDLILHHYPYSPFAEKIRAVLGYTQTNWVSCLTSEAPPRDELMLLTGGYNRIPVIQIGSDIFCDTNLISEELSALAAQPALSALSLSEDEKSTQRQIETKLFFACVHQGFTLKLLGRMVKMKGFISLGKFLKDRIGMGKTASISMGSPKSAPHVVEKFKTELSATLGDQPYFGGEQPSIKDFAIYHCFWFTQFVGQKQVLETGSSLANWYEKIHRFSAEPSEEITIREALAHAKNTEARALDEAWLGDENIGKRVAITPSDYRKEPVVGKLVAVSDSRYVLARQTSDTGEVHVHFPKENYDLETL